ncbi:MAG TPA: hypothetical protein VIH89_13425 [Candidatus Sulfotelmatobacter sp.]
MAEVSRTSVNQRQQPAWARFALPSVSDLIFIVLLGMLLCTPLSVKLLGDGGIGWHIRAGQMIAATQTIPRVDSFSSTMSGQPWFAWEWFYDLAVGQLERVAALNGVVWLTAVTIAMVFSWMFRVLIQRGASLVLSLALMLLAASASMLHFLARPHVISWFFTLVWFWILDAGELATISEGGGVGKPGRNRLLWFLPLLMLVWVNVHGGFLVAFALLAIYWLSAAYTWFALPETRWEDAMIKLRARKRTMQLFLAGGLTVLATFCNPYGWRLYAHIYLYLTNRFLIDHIDEFQSPNFHGAAERCFAALMLIALVALAARRRTLRLSEGLVVLFAVYSGLYAVRNVPVSSLLLALVAGPLLKESMPRFGASVSGFFHRMKEMELSLRGHLWPVVLTVAALCVALNGGNVEAHRLMDAHFSGRRFPVEAVNYLEQGEAWGPILAPDYWGGYLIYRLYPRTQVVVDDRHDFYGEGFLRDYVTMIHAEQDWEKFLTEHDVCCVLAPKGSAMANILTQSKDWKEIYSDDVAEVFEKSH